MNSFLRRRRVGTSPWRWLSRLTLGAGTAFAWQAGRIYHGVRRGRPTAKVATPFETHPPRSRARVLMVGDSTGVGVGCERPEDTLAGLLAADFPQVEIVNRCNNGARLADAVAQCEPLVYVGERFDLAIISVGGNDVMRLTPSMRLERESRALLTLTRRLARRVVWMGSANIGGSPLLMAPFSWLVGWHTGRTMRRLAEQARQFDAEFIDFVRYGRDDLFARRADLYFADDGVHPSAASYRLCYEVLKQRTQLCALLTRRPTAVNFEPAARAVLHLPHGPHEAQAVHGEDAADPSRPSHPSPRDRSSRA